MPLGLLVTVPVPVPVLLTDRLYVFSVNSAVTEVPAVMVMLQVLIPEQPPPLQPAKVEPVKGEAVKVTIVL